MNINFNNITDAYYSNQIALNKIYGRNGLLLWERSSGPEPPLPIINEYDPEPDSIYYDMPLTIEMLESGTFLFEKTFTQATQSVSGLQFQYSLDDINWIIVTNNDMNITYDGSNITKVEWSINLNTNDKIKIKASNNSGYGPLGNANNGATVRLLINSKCNVYGNLLSLVFPSGDYAEYSSHYASAWFRKIFNTSKIVDASNLIVPAYATMQMFYQSMFQDCDELLYPPKIKHIVTTNSGTPNSYKFERMFQGCIKMEANPVLPSFVNSIWQSPANYMFAGCTSIHSEPNLYIGTSDAIMMNFRFGDHMFEGCNKISSIMITYNKATTYLNRYIKWTFKGLNTNGGILYCSSSSVANKINDAASDIMTTNWVAQKK